MTISYGGAAPILLLPDFILGTLYLSMGYICLCLLSEMVPEMLRTSISHAVLYLKSVDVIDVLSFEYLDPPDEDQVLVRVSVRCTHYQI